MSKQIQVSDLASFAGKLICTTSRSLISFLKLSFISSHEGCRSTALLNETKPFKFLIQKRGISVQNSHEWGECRLRLMPLRLTHGTHSGKLWWPIFNGKLYFRKIAGERQYNYVEISAEDWWDDQSSGW